MVINVPYGDDIALSNKNSDLEYSKPFESVKSVNQLSNVDIDGVPIKSDLSLPHDTSIFLCVDSLTADSSVDEILEVYYKQAKIFESLMKSLDEKAENSKKFLDLIESGIYWKAKCIESKELSEITAYTHGMKVKDLEKHIRDLNDTNDCYSSKLISSQDKITSLNEQLSRTRQENAILLEFKKGIIGKHIKSDDTDYSSHQEDGIFSKSDHDPLSSESPVKSSLSSFDSGRTTGAAQISNEHPVKPRSNSFDNLMNDKNSPNVMADDLIAILRQVQKLEKQMEDGDKILFSTQSRCRSLEDELAFYEENREGVNLYLRSVFDRVVDLSENLKNTHKIIIDYLEKHLSEEEFRSKVSLSITKLSQNFDIIRNDVKVQSRTLFKKYNAGKFSTVDNCDLEQETDPYFAELDRRLDPSLSMENKKDQPSAIAALLNDIRNRAPKLKKIQPIEDEKKSAEDQYYKRNSRNHNLPEFKSVQESLQLAIQKQRFAVDDQREDNDYWSD